MGVTIREISRHTGLSIPTVGNVLGRNGGRYSAATQKKILDAAREMGYKPNASARAMRRGRFGCAALVLGRSRQGLVSHIPSGLMDGLDEALTARDMHLTLARLTDDELSSGAFLPKVMRESMADGMIVNYTHNIPPRMRELIKLSGAAAVWVNARLDSDCVHPDDFGAAFAATRELIAMGHRRIALLHLISPGVFDRPFEEEKRSFHFSNVDRAAGYAAAMAGAGLAPRIVDHDRFIPDHDQMEACRALLRGNARPTAVCVYSERDVSLLLAAALEARLSVPRDLSVMVFSPVEVWSAGHYVSAALIPTAEVGRRAVEMLMRKIAAPNMSLPPDAVPYGPPLGQTTIAPPSPTPIGATNEVH